MVSGGEARAAQVVDQQRSGRRRHINIKKKSCCAGVGTIAGADRYDAVQTRLAPGGDTNAMDTWKVSRV